MDCSCNTMWYVILYELKWIENANNEYSMHDDIVNCIWLAQVLSYVIALMKYFLYFILLFWINNGQWIKNWPFVVLFRYFFFQIKIKIYYKNRISIFIYLSRFFFFNNWIKSNFSTDFSIVGNGIVIHC